jgi:hypothetical protein
MVLIGRLNSLNAGLPQLVVVPSLPMLAFEWLFPAADPGDVQEAVGHPELLPTPATIAPRY